MKNKTVSMLLSLVIAFGLWVYVITEISPNSETTIDDIPLIAQGETILSERGLMVTKWSSTNVDLTLSGNRSDLNELNRSNITLKVDLSGISEPGTYKIDYTTSYPGNVADNAVNRERQHPESISITVERRATKSVQVQAEYLGETPKGYVSRRGDILLDNKTVIVTGPQSVVDQISKAVVTIDLTDRTESISQNYRYTLCNQEGEPVDSALITVNVEEVHVELTIHRIKQVELAVTIVAGGGATNENVICDISPKTIQISGSDAALEQVGDVLILGEIDLADYEAADKLVFQIPAFEGVTNESGKVEATVDLRFEGLSTREIVINQFAPVNVPEGLEAQVITEQLTLVVRGPENLVGKLTAANITATVDFTGMGVGVSTYQARIQFSEEFAALGVLRMSSVTAELKEPAEDETVPPEANG